MTKAELAKKISAATGVETVTVLPVIDSMMACIKDSLSKGEPVFLRGFGTFANKTRKAKTARNILARTTIVIPEHAEPSFKPCKEFKSIIK